MTKRNLELAIWPDRPKGEHWRDPSPIKEFKGEYEGMGSAIPFYLGNVDGWFLWVWHPDTKRQATYSYRQDKIIDFQACESIMTGIML